MNQVWTDADLSEHWLLSDNDRSLLKGKAELGRLALAIQLKHYQLYACFPKCMQDIPSPVLEFLRFQVDAPTEGLEDYDCNGRSGCQHRREIFLYLDIKPFGKRVEVVFRKWLIDKVFPEVPNRAYLDELVTAWLLENQNDRPGSYRLDRIIKSAEREFEEQLFQTIYNRLNKTTRARLDGILEDKEGVFEFSHLCADMGPVSLKSVLQTIDRLEILRAIGIQNGILRGINSKLIKRYRQRAATENAWELRRHPRKICYPLLVFYCVPREGEIIDSLIDLLIQVIHKISARSERRIVKV